MLFPLPAGPGRTAAQTRLRGLDGSRSSPRARGAAPRPRGGGKVFRLGPKREVVGRAGPRRQAPLGCRRSPLPRALGVSHSSVQKPRRQRSPSAWSCRLGGAALLRDAGQAGDERDVTWHPRAASARQSGAPVPPCPHVVLHVGDPSRAVRRPSDGPLREYRRRQENVLIGTFPLGEEEGCTER